MRPRTSGVPIDAGRPSQAATHPRRPAAGGFFDEPPTQPLPAAGGGNSRTARRPPLAHRRRGKRAADRVRGGGGTRAVRSPAFLSSVLQGWPSVNTAAVCTSARVVGRYGVSFCAPGFGKGHSVWGAAVGVAGGGQGGGVVWTLLPRPLRVARQARRDGAGGARGRACRACRQARGGATAGSGGAEGGRARGGEEDWRGRPSLPGIPKIGHIGPCTRARPDRRCHPLPPPSASGAAIARATPLRARARGAIVPSTPSATMYLQRPPSVVRSLRSPTTATRVGLKTAVLGGGERRGAATGQSVTKVRALERCQVGPLPLPLFRAPLGRTA